MRFPWPFRRRSSPVAPVLVDPWQQVHGTGQDWVPSTYGDYIATNATLYSCVMLRARNLARVTLRIHTTAGEARGAGALARGPARNPRSVPVPPSHPAQALFDNVNPHWTCRSFWYQVEASLCLWGSAPIAIFHDGAGTPAELWWLNPHRFRAVPHKTDYIQGYIYEKDGREIAFEPHEVMWLRYPNPIDEYAALSPLAALRMTVDMNTDAVAFNRRFFQNDGTPGRVYIKTEATLTRAEATALRARWEEAFKGPNKSHRIAVLDKSADLASLGVSQKDMDFTEGQRFTKEEIAGAFGVPPMLIGDLRHATLNNFRVAKTSFWDETMVPELELVEGFINHVLTPQLGSGLTANFDLSEIAALREDQSEKAKRQKLLTESGYHRRQVRPPGHSQERPAREHLRSPVACQRPDGRGRHRRQGDLRRECHRHRPSPRRQPQRMVPRLPEGDAHRDRARHREDPDQDGGQLPHGPGSPRVPVLRQAHRPRLRHYRGLAPTTPSTRGSPGERPYGAAHTSASGVSELYPTPGSPWGSHLAPGGKPGGSRARDSPASPSQGTSRRKSTMKIANSSKTVSAAGTIAAAFAVGQEGAGSSPRMYPSTARCRYEE